MLQTTGSIQTVAQTDLSSRIQAAAIAGLLGVFILLGVGFAQSDVLHNAAHDSRHSLSLPCH